MHMNLVEEEGPSEGGLSISISDLLKPQEATSEPPDTNTAHPFSGVIIGLLAGLDSSGPRVEFPRNPASNPVRARSVVPLNATHVGSDVVLMFVGGDPSRPILLGIIHQSQRETKT